MNPPRFRLRIGHGAYRVDCPKCEQQADNPCVLTLDDARGPQRMSRPHLARVLAAIEAQKARARD